MPWDIPPLAQIAPPPPAPPFPPPQKKGKIHGLYKNSSLPPQIFHADNCRQLRLDNVIIILL